MIPNIASGSVCPSGWTLPSSEEYGDLVTTKYEIISSTNTAKIWQKPLSFNYKTGYYNYGTGSMVGETTIGMYWSGTVYTSNANNAYILSARTSVVFPQNNYNRGYGYAIRCGCGE